MNRIVIASWMFLIGSSLFMVDSLVEVARGISLMSISHLSEGLLFLVGSVFFMPNKNEE